MKSIIQWVGGKTKLMDEIKKLVPIKYNNYYEPFLGSGAVLLSLLPKKAICGDQNKIIIYLFNTIKSNHNSFIEALKKLKRVMIKQTKQEKFYYYIRDRFNKEKSLTIEKLAMFMYLNRNCFNSLYRENSEGEFNVPYGKKIRLNFYNLEDIMNVHNYLKNNKIIFTNTSFENTLSSVKKGDFVFLDPPYIKQTQGALTKYTKEDFSNDMHKSLADLYRSLDKKGAYLMLTNSDNKIVRQLYKGFKIKGFRTNMNLNRDKDNRKLSYKEVIITNY
jgi:DNA adenine methylase